MSLVERIATIEGQPQNLPFTGWPEGINRQHQSSPNKRLIFSVRRTEKMYTHGLTLEWREFFRNLRTSR